MENETINLVPQTGIMNIRMCSQHITNMITKQKQDVDTILVDFNFLYSSFHLTEKGTTDALFFLLTILLPEGRKKNI